ncbi:MAG: aminoacyl-tRNA hydrolase [Patescibacteria group bacterium]|nr:aminoacyl-tRNA hydrolase [Patescibacteria group bacterium]
MKLIVGLGNPGKKYEQTWHNLGFMVIDNYLKEYQDQTKVKKKFDAEFFEINEIGEKIILAKPQTFMNQSGVAVKQIAKFYKIAVPDIWVIHDDIDLPLGKIRISHNASAAGHRGVQSVIEELGSQAFARFRLGIQPEPPINVNAEDYVLRPMGRIAKIKAEEMIEEVLSALEIALATNLTDAMNDFN